MYRRTNIMHIFVSLLQSEDSTIMSYTDDLRPIPQKTCQLSSKRPFRLNPQHFLDDRPQVCSQPSPIHAAGEKIVAAAGKKLRLA